MTSVYTPNSAPTPDAPPPASGLDGSLVMFGYLCLFFTVVFAGVPAFLAAVLAYARRGEATPLMRSHYNLQIGIFWCALSLTLLSLAAMIAAIVIGVANLADLSGAYGAVLQTARTGIPASPSTGWTLLLVSAGLFILAVVWTWVGSIWGGLKLAAGEPIGRPKTPTVSF